MTNFQKFEQRVRDTASLLWNRQAEKDRIDGVNLDCVVKVKPDWWIIIEITTHHDLDKVRGDVSRLSLVAQSLYQNQRIMTESFMVMEKPPTQGMVDAGKGAHIKVVSFSKFERNFFDYPAYVGTRKKAQFGSAVNPITGEPDNSEYVPVSYRFGDSSKPHSISDIASLLRAGKKMVLLGEYGAGKSRCIKEVFSSLGSSEGEDGNYYLSIDLRRAWGLQSANEIIRRHFEELGLSNSSDRLLRALQAGRVCFLLDGFDELGSQSWSNNSTKLQNIRYETLKGVREIVANNKSGMLICGREHYFNSFDELFRSLGLPQADTTVIRCQGEFTDEEMEAFLEKLNIDVPVPDWLPKRPLMCQAIANLKPDEIGRMFDEDGGDIEFWHTFMKVVCERESLIRSSLDAATILQVLQQLARITRTKSAGVGPLSLSEIQKAFESVLGQDPVEGASVMLQRLPGLGRTEIESDDRKFIDIYIVDGLRALDVSKSVVTHDYGVTRERWINPLGELGLRVLGREIDESQSGQNYMRYAERALSDGNTIVASDIVASHLHRNISVMDYGGFVLNEGHLSHFNMSAVAPKNLTVKHSIIEHLMFPMHQLDRIKIENCAVENVYGVSDVKGLPEWMKDTSVETYESVVNVSGIKNVRLTHPHRILVTILKKTFFQKGKGRQETALLRGLGQIDRSGNVQKILSYLVSNEILDKAKGDHGNIFIPVIKNKSRVGKILSELNMSTDSIWEWVSHL